MKNVTFILIWLSVAGSLTSNAWCSEYVEALVLKQLNSEQTLLSLNPNRIVDTITRCEFNSSFTANDSIALSGTYLTLVESVNQSEEAFSTATQQYEKGIESFKKDQYELALWNFRKARCYHSNSFRAICNHAISIVHGAKSDWGASDLAIRRSWALDRRYEIHLQRILAKLCIEEWDSAIVFGHDFQPRTEIDGNQFHSGMALAFSFDENKLDQANWHLNQVSDSFHRDFVLLLRGNLQYKTGNTSKAIRSYQELIAMSQSHTSGLVNLARVLSDTGEKNSIIFRLIDRARLNEGGLRHDTRVIWFNAVFSDSFPLREAQLQERLLEFDRASDFFISGLYHLKSGDTSEAQLRFKLGLERDSNSLENLVALATLARVTGAIDNYFYYIKRVRSIDPDNDYGVKFAAYDALRSGENLDVFVALLEKCSVNNAIDNYNLATVHYLKGRLDQAMDKVKISQTQDSFLQPNTLLGATIAFEQRHYSEMRHFLKRLDIEYQAKAYVLLGNYENRAENWASAANYYKLSIAMDSTYDALAGLGCSYIGSKQFPKAIKCYEAALKFDHSHVELGRVEANIAVINYKKWELSGDQEAGDSALAIMEDLTSWSDNSYFNNNMGFYLSVISQSDEDALPYFKGSDELSAYNGGLLTLRLDRTCEGFKTGIALIEKSLRLSEGSFQPIVRGYDRIRKTCNLDDEIECDSNSVYPCPGLDVSDPKSSVMYYFFLNHNIIPEFEPAVYELPKYYDPLRYPSFGPLVRSSFIMPDVSMMTKDEKLTPREIEQEIEDYLKGSKESDDSDDSKD